MRITIRFGKPLEFGRFAGLDGEHAALRAVTDEIMYEILRLSGQEYVDMYANEAKAQQQAPRGLTRRLRPDRGVRSSD